MKLDLQRTLKNIENIQVNMDATDKRVKRDKWKWLIIGWLGGIVTSIIANAISKALGI